jgi:hypothetical protein
VTRGAREATFAAFAALIVTTVPASAHAASTIRDPNPPQYGIEIEPHLNVQGLHDGGGAFGFCGGARVSIPLASPGFIRTINDSIAISFGGDAIDVTSSAEICADQACVAGPSFWVVYARWCSSGTSFSPRNGACSASEGSRCGTRS